MSKLLRLPDHARTQEEAAAWLMRLDGNDLTAEERDRLHAWLADKPNREALQKLARLWGQMDCLAILAELFPNTSATSARSPSQPPSQSETPRARPRSHWVGAALAASLTLALAIGAMYPFQQTQIDPVELVYETALGEQSRLTLKDGSTMLLNTDSRARVLFSAHERAIHLTRGEAHFEVAKNPTLPFVVYAGLGAVRATGTAFNVRVETDHMVDVLVDEGTVEVKTAPPAASPITAEPTTLKLRQGGSARFDSAIKTSAYLPPSEIEQRLAWRNGKWQFEGETLAEVIAEVNRYTDKRIEITDPRIATLRIGGYFNIGAVDSLLDVLEDGFGVRVTRTDNGHILLSALDSPAP